MTQSTQVPDVGSQLFLPPGSFVQFRNVVHDVGATHTPLVQCCPDWQSKSVLHETHLPLTTSQMWAEPATQSRLLQHAA